MFPVLAMCPVHLFSRIVSPRLQATRIFEPDAFPPPNPSSGDGMVLFVMSSNLSPEECYRADSIAADP